MHLSKTTIDRILARIDRDAEIMKHYKVRVDGAYLRSDIEKKLVERFTTRSEALDHAAAALDNGAEKVEVIYFEDSVGTTAIELKFVN